MDIYADLFTVLVFIIYMMYCAYWKYKNTQSILEVIKSSAFQFRKKTYLKFVAIALFFTVALISIVTWRLYHILSFTKLDMGAGVAIALLWFFCLSMWTIGVATVFKVILSIHRVHS